MKTALVSPYDFAYPGGVNTHVRHLHSALRRLGVNAFLIAPGIDPGDDPVHRLAVKGRMQRFSSGGSRARVCLDPRVLWYCREVLKRHRFDIVHLHNPLAPMVCAGFLWSRPVVPATAFVGTFHEFRSTPNPAIEAGKPLFRRWIGRLDGRIAVSTASLRFNRACFPGEYTVIPNGIDIHRFNPAAGRGAPERDGFVVLFVGRMEARKGFSYLLQAFAGVRRRFKNTRLKVVGPGPFRGPRQPNTRAAGVDFLGAVPDDDLPGLYARADVFCAPSVDYESFGIVLLEAMAAATPVVASDIPGYRCVVDHGRQGVLVAPRCPEAIEQGIVSLLSDAALRRRMGQAARERAEAYHWGGVAERVLGYYHHILRAKRPGWPGRRYPEGKRPPRTRPAGKEVCPE